MGQDTIDHVSDTALWVATYRAMESERPDALFHDSLAGVLAGERGRRLARMMKMSRAMSWVMVVRTTSIDRLVLDCVAEQVDTVLNLGAGLDTRPYRMKLPSSLRWIEVDFPHLIEMKNEKLRHETPVCRLERVAMDLSRRELRQEFFKRVSGESKKVLVISEGVMPYLPADEVGRVADDLFTLPNFQFWIQDCHLRRRRPMVWRKKLKSAPLVFNVPDWFGFFAEHGWRCREVVWPADESKRIGRPIPFFFPWSLLFLVMPANAREKWARAFGFTLLERKQ